MNIKCRQLLAWALVLFYGGCVAVQAEQLSFVAVSGLLLMAGWPWEADREAERQRREKAGQS